MFHFETDTLMTMMQHSTNHEFLAAKHHTVIETCNRKPMTLHFYKKKVLQHFVKLGRAKV